MFVFAPAPQAVVPVSGEKNVFFPVNRKGDIGRLILDDGCGDAGSGE